MAKQEITLVSAVEHIIKRRLKARRDIHQYRRLNNFQYRKRHFPARTLFTAARRAPRQTLLEGPMTLAQSSDLFKVETAIIELQGCYANNAPLLRLLSLLNPFYVIVQI